MSAAVTSAGPSERDIRKRFGLPGMTDAHVAVGVDDAFHRQNAVGDGEVLEERRRDRPAGRQRGLRRGGATTGSDGDDDGEGGGGGKTGRPGHDCPFRWRD